MIVNRCCSFDTEQNPANCCLVAQYGRRAPVLADCPAQNIGEFRKFEENEVMCWNSVSI